MESRIAAFVGRRWSVPENVLRIQVEPLRGGLESVVSLARVAHDAGHPSIPQQFVIKELRAGGAREAGIYDMLWRHVRKPPAVQALGVEAVGDTTYLYLERAAACSPWPWADTALAAAVCRELARFHDDARTLDGIADWDYEAELQQSAAGTLDAARSSRDHDGRRYWRRLGDLRRVVAALPRIRSRLLAGGTAVIHGDVHPGNVILTSARPVPQVALIDWGRARVGSPVEDVASWLHSLGCWEPQARRRHDTLMRAYLDARAVPRPFAGRLREDYWYASASNGLSGAIRYHLAVLCDEASTGSMRDDSHWALIAWERVIRRAAALLSTSPAC